MGYIDLSEGGAWAIGGLPRTYICPMTEMGFFKAPFLLQNVTFRDTFCDHTLLPTLFCDHKFNLNKNKIIFVDPLTSGHGVIYNT